MKHRTFILFLLFASHIGLAQEIAFKTTVSKNRLGVNERLRIVFSVDKQGIDDFRPPKFRNFKIVGGPMTSQQHSYVNGKQSFEQSYTYTIQPIKKGAFIIPPAFATFNGATIKTNTLKVTVTDAINIPKDPNDPSYIASQNIHLIAEISNTNPFVGESISVVYKIYVDVNQVNVRNTREVESPSFNGFWNQNIEVKQWEAKEGSFQGRPHRYAIIKKTVLIPQKAGQLTIEPMQIEISAGVPIGRRDLFGNMITKNINFTATTGKRIVNVKSLPLENRPLDFSGAVGDFDFNIIANKSQLKANEPAEIKVSVSGKGNLKLIELPTIDTPNGLEKYEPEHSEKIRTTLSGLNGGVYDRYTVVPQFRGKFKIPVVEFSYFSLKEKVYKTLSSAPIIINVNEGKTPTEVNTNTAVFKKDVISQAKDIRFIKMNTVLKTISRDKNFLGSNLFYALLLMPLLSIPIGIFAGMKKKERDGDIAENKRRKADRLAKKYLSEAKTQLGNKEQFYISLEKALHNYLKAKLRVETADISKERIASLLTQKNVESSIINQFTKVLDDCDFARYSPGMDVMMQQEYNNAKEVLSKIDKQL